MPLSKTKIEELRMRMERLGITEADLVEKFILGQGRGGQKLQKTSSTVYLKHLPSGIEIKCQRERSREMNRYFARKELCDKLEENLLQEKSKKQQLFEKIRRQKKRRSRRSQLKIREEKTHLSEKKALRHPPSIE